MTSFTDDPQSEAFSQLICLFNQYLTISFCSGRFDLSWHWNCNGVRSIWRFERTVLDLGWRIYKNPNFVRLESWKPILRELDKKMIMKQLQLLKLFMLEYLVKWYNCFCCYSLSCCCTCPYKLWRHTGNRLAPNLATWTWTGSRLEQYLIIQISMKIKKI